MRSLRPQLMSVADRRCSRHKPLLAMPVDTVLVLGLECLRIQRENVLVQQCPRSHIVAVVLSDRAGVDGIIVI